MEKTEFFDITPHRSIMTKIGETNYTLQEALSELIDNSIDARVDGEVLKLELVVNDNIVSIKDNGVGMEKKTMANSLKLGYSEKVGSLGEFGLGMKSSINCLGGNFTITSTTRDSKEIFIVKFNQKDWLKKGDWKNFPIIIKDKTKNDFQHGTLIEITNLKTRFNEGIIDKTIFELNMRFSQFIQSGQLELVINGKKCQDVNFGIIKGTKQEINKKIGKITISGWWAYKLQDVDKTFFGFNTFRRGRLVTVLDKMGLSRNEAIKQIIGELNITGVPISHDKTGWITTSDEYFELVTFLRSYFANLEYKPKKILTGFPASKGLVQGKVKLLNDNIYKSAELEESINKVGKGDIVVTPMTRPTYLIAVRRSCGIITDLGGALCHAAICAREFGIPAVVGTQTATKMLRDGQKIIIDGTEGVVYEDDWFAKLYIESSKFFTKW